MARKPARVAIAGVLALAGLVTIAGALGAGAAAPSAARSHRAGVASPWRTYRDVTGWRALYPAGYHLEVSEQELGLSMAEVTLATFRPRPGILVRTYPGSGNVRAVPPLDPAGRFPPDGIALRVISDAGSPAFALHNTRLRRPITLASLQPSDGPTGLGYNATTGETPHAGRYHGAPRSRARTIDLNGTEFTIVVWIGPRASAGERRALTRMLASLTFPKPTGS